jgi:hypothetical protein
MKKKVLPEDETPFEVQPIQQKPELEIASSFEELIKHELTKYDSVVPAVNELAKEFMPLKIQSLDDKDGYNEVSKALRFIVSKRTAVEEKRKELKADSLAYGRAVDARAKEIIAMLDPIESHLKNERLRIDSEIERLKAEEEEKKKSFINDRINALISLGMYQTMTEFIWRSTLNPEEEENFLRVNLELFSDYDFNEFVTFLSQKVKAEKEAIIFRDAQQKAEAERIEKMRNELEEEKQSIAKEMREIKEIRAVSRNESLCNLGLGTVSYNPHWVFMKKSNVSIVDMVHKDDVLNMSADEWKEKFEQVKSDYEILKAEEEKLEAINEALFKEKLLKEQDDFVYGKSDKDLYIDYLDRLKQVPVPVLATKKWQSYILTITKAIENFKKIN